MERSGVGWGRARRIPVLSECGGKRQTRWVAWTEASEQSDAPEDDPTARQIIYVSRPAGSTWNPRATHAPRSHTSIYVSLYANLDDQRTTVDAIWLENTDDAHKSIWYARLGG